MKRVLSCLLFILTSLSTFAQDDEGERPSAVNDWQVYKDHQQRSYRSAQQLQGNWIPLGPRYVDSTYNNGNSGVGLASVVAVSASDSNIIFVGTPAGGLWKSTTGGDSWTQMMSSMAALGAYSISIDPTDPNIIYTLINN